MFEMVLEGPALQLAGAAIELAVNWLAQSTLVIAAGLAIGAALRGRGSAVQSVVYRTTLVAALACPLATLALSLAGVSGWSIGTPALIATAPATPTADPLPETAVEPPAAALNAFTLPLVQAPGAELSAQSSDVSATERVTPTVDAALPTAAAAWVVDENAGSPAPTVEAGSVLTAFGVAALVGVALWFMICAVLVCRLAWAWRSLARLRRGAVLAERATQQLCDSLAARLAIASPAVLRSPWLPSPCLAGVRRPAVLLPVCESEAPLGDVIAHELAHLKRRDTLWNLLRRVATSVLFFQPLLWRLSHRIETTAEEVCDDYVVALGSDRADYADRLLSLAEMGHAPIAAAGVGIVSFRSMLGRRVARVLDTSRSLSTRAGNLTLATVLIAGALGAGVAGLVGLAPPSQAGESQVGADGLNGGAESDKASGGETIGSREIGVTIDAAPDEASQDDADSGDLDDVVPVTGAVIRPDAKPAGGARVAVDAGRLGARPGGEVEDVRLATDDELLSMAASEPMNEDNEPLRIGLPPDPHLGSTQAQALAIRLHREAAKIDQLPRFLITARAGTLSFKPLPDSPAEPLACLLTALDATTDDPDWFHYEKRFGWDESAFIDQLLRGGPDGQEDEPAWPRSTRWGTRELGGARHRSGRDGPDTVVIRKDAAAMWRDNTVSNPNYLLATKHDFWFGDNDYIHQNFSSISPELANYNFLNAEEFDGEMCDVVESPRRHERLWFSQSTGRLRGYLQRSYHTTSPDFHKSKVVEDVAGRSFASASEYREWSRSKHDGLSPEGKLRLSLAWLDEQDFDTARPGLLVRFRDYREVAPGVWWPFHEDRVQGFPSDKGFECMWSYYRVRSVDTDTDLTDEVRGLMPKDGETVQDQRFESVITYDYRADRTEEELRQLAAEAQRKREDSRALIEKRQTPYQQLVGRPAPTLPDETWVGGDRPEVDGAPYLIQIWHVSCAPCKNDFPLLKQLAEGGVTVIGLHPTGDGADREAVAAAIEQGELAHATCLAEADSEGRVAGYPVAMYPYYVLVDAQGRVDSHGFLTANDGEMLQRLGELRRASQPE